MIAQGYSADPLSPEMERRIRERIRLEEDELRIAALEWVLNEAHAIRLTTEQTVNRLMPGNPCPNCGHEHLDESRCNFPYAQDRECACERKVTA